MCGYHCPFAERKPCAGFLLCRNMFKSGVNYNERKNAMNVICAFQKQCMRTGRMENTDSAKACYEMHVSAHRPTMGMSPLGTAARIVEPVDEAVVEPVVEAEAEPVVEPEEKPKTTRKRKKKTTDD